MLEHARGDNAHDADVPKQLAFDDDEVARRIELGPHRADGLIGDAALDSLAFAVLRVQLLRQRHRFGQAAGHEQVESGFCGLQPARGIEARGELEADFVGPQRSGGLTDFFQSQQTGSLSRIQSLQTG